MVLIFNKDELLQNTCDDESYMDDVLFNVSIWLDDAGDYLPQARNKPQQKKSLTGNVNETDIPPTQKVASTDTSDIKNQQTLLQDINSAFVLERNPGMDLTQGIQSQSDLNTRLSYYDIVKKSARIQSVIRMIGRSQAVQVDQHDKNGFNQMNTDGIQAENALPDE